MLPVMAVENFVNSVYKSPEFLLIMLRVKDNKLYCDFLRVRKRELLI